jgi:hypothetical protein
MSVAYGARCLQANAHPLDILAANVATFVRDPDQWREGVIEEYQDMVDDTLHHLDRTEAEFIEMIKADVKMFEEYHAKEGQDGTK